MTWEQGLGDTLQYIRYAPLVKAQGCTVLLLCQPRLCALLRRCPGIDRLLPQGQATPDFDVHAPLASLPWRLTIVGDRTRDQAAAAQLDADIASHKLAGRIDIAGALAEIRQSPLQLGAFGEGPAVVP